MIRAATAPTLNRSAMECAAPIRGSAPFSQTMSAEAFRQIASWRVLFTAWC